MTPDQQDAARYRALKPYLEFVLGSYHSVEGSFAQADKAQWHLRTPSIFRGDPHPPVDLDAAVDDLIKNGPYRM